MTTLILHLTSQLLLQRLGIPLALMGQESKGRAAPLAVCTGGRECCRRYRQQQESSRYRAATHS